MLEVVSDDFATWELRIHFGQTATVPEQPPTTNERLRVAYNQSLVEKDVGRAAILKEQLLAALDTSRAATFSHGTKLLGTTLQQGVRRSLVLWFESVGPAEDSLQLEMYSKIVRGPALSLVPVPTQEKEVLARFSLHPELWRAGFLYTAVAEIQDRPGRESLELSWVVDSEAGVVPTVGGKTRYPLFELD